MEVIVCEHGLWPEARLPTECKGFKCKPGATTYCCCQLLFNQPTFIVQRLQLEKLVTWPGQICDFYPMFHPKLNFIKQYWSLAKHHYWLTPDTQSAIKMEKNVLNSQDGPGVEQIQQWADLWLLWYDIKQDLESLFWQICQQISPLYQCLYSGLEQCRGYMGKL